MRRARRPRSQGKRRKSQFLAQPQTIVQAAQIAFCSTTPNVRNTSLTRNLGAGRYRAAIRLKYNSDLYCTNSQDKSISGRHFSTSRRCELRRLPAHCPPAKVTHAMGARGVSLRGPKREAGANPAQGRCCNRSEARATCHCDHTSREGRPGIATSRKPEDLPVASAVRALTRGPHVVRGLGPRPPGGPVPVPRCACAATAPFRARVPPRLARPTRRAGAKPDVS